MSENGASSGRVIGEAVVSVIVLERSRANLEDHLYQEETFTRPHLVAIQRMTRGVTYACPHTEVVYQLHLESVICFRAASNGSKQKCVITGSKATAETEECLMG